MITYRAMTRDDAAGVADVEEACFAIPWSRESFWKEADNPFAFYILAFDGEKVVGFIGCWITIDEAQITNVAVLPSYRNRGIGRGLLETMIREVQKKGVTAMTLEVRPSNAPALALYERFGFKTAGRRKKYYQDNGEDALIMWNTKLAETSPQGMGDVYGSNENHSKE